jgi:hypothetical protein
MPPNFTNIPDMSLWSQSIGGLVINFGGLEFQTLRWLHIFGGEFSVRTVQSRPMSQRIDSVLELLEGSRLSIESQAKAGALWEEVRSLSVIRNRIVHNPICLGRDAASGETRFSVIDLKKMVPVGENSLEPLHYQQIAEIAIRASDINRALSEIAEQP